MYSTFSNMWKNLQYNSDQQYITTAQCVIIVDIQEYKTLVKKLATIDFKIMDLVKRHQEITHLQSKLIKECKNIDIQLDKKILQKCTFEKAKFAMLPSINMPPNTSPQAQQFTKKPVPHSWQHIGKWNSNTRQISNVKKIRKELFKFDDIDDDILTNAAFEAESKLSSVKWKNNYNLCDT